jgi:hypothetical protein
MFSLLVSDGTGYLPIILSGEEATYFFHSHAPCKIIDSSLEKMLSLLWTRSRTKRVFESKVHLYRIEAFQIEQSGEKQVRYKVVNTRL